MSECDYPECTNRATAVYEGIDPPAGTIRYKSCYKCGPKVTPVRYLEDD